jgi:hypothetical protein
VLPREVVPDGIERDHVNVALELFREGISQPHKAGHVHPHREVLTFGESSISPVAIRMTWTALPDHVSGALLSLGAFGHLRSSQLLH